MKRGHYSFIVNYMRQAFDINNNNYTIHNVRDICLNCLKELTTFVLADIWQNNTKCSKYFHVIQHPQFVCIFTIDFYLIVVEHFIVIHYVFVVIVQSKMFYCRILLPKCYIWGDFYYRIIIKDLVSLILMPLVKRGRRRTKPQCIEVYNNTAAEMQQTIIRIVDSAARRVCYNQLSYS